MKKLLKSQCLIIGLITIPFLLCGLLNIIFNDKMPPIIGIIAWLFISVVLILLVINIIKYCSEKTGKSVAKTIVTIGIGVLIFFILLIYISIESGKRISEIGFILPLIK